MFDMLCHKNIPAAFTIIFVYGVICHFHDYLALFSSRVSFIQLLVSNKLP